MAPASVPGFFSSLQGAPVTADAQKREPPPALAPDHPSGETPLSADAYENPKTQRYPAWPGALYQWSQSMIGDAAEEREHYQPGGYHPVELGATFGDGGRYRVIHKLGHGGSATVWLARDHVEQSYVALKIMIAHVSDKNVSLELRWLETLQAAGLSHEGAKYFGMPLDHFRFQGPNGSHFCLVSRVLGPRISDRNVQWDCPGHIKREAAQQATEALAFLHAAGFGHGDFRPANILIRVVDFDMLTEEELFKRLGKPNLDRVVTATGGPPGPSAPPYVVGAADLNGLIFKNEIEVIDFGEAFSLDLPRGDLGTPAGYRSPEVLFDKRVGVASDLWALACSLYQIRTGRALFEMFLGNLDEVIEQFVQLFGKLLEPWWHQWEARNHHFDDDAWPKLKADTGKPMAYTFTLPQLIRGDIPLLAPLPEGTEVMSAEEVDCFADLLQRLLTYRPEDRINAAEALKHPWFHRKFFP